MNHYTIIVFAALFALAFSSCEKRDPGFSGQGKVPVYASLDELNDIRSTNPQSIVETGPIFLINDFFFMIEQGRGIHIFNIADEEQIAPLTFIQIPAVTDFTVDGHFLYADSWKDLVTIDISDIYEVELVNRQADVFEPFLHPRLYVGPFECFDESKGAIIAWEDEVVNNVLCRTF